MTEQSAPALPALNCGSRCGAIRYSARPDNREDYNCHFCICQLAFGNNRSTFLNLRKRKVEWASRPTLCASSKFVVRGFCNRCGTPLSFKYLDFERMDLSAGSLDDPSAISPELRIANWHADDGLPGERRDASPALTKRRQENHGSDVLPGLAATRDDPAG